MRIPQTLPFFAVSLLAMALPNQYTFAQEVETYPIINQIITEFDGFRSTSDQYVMGNIQLRPGMNYNPALLDQSIRALYNTGYFEFVEARVDKAQDQTVDVVFKLVSKYTIERIRFLGNDKYTSQCSRLANPREARVEPAFPQLQPCKLAP